MSERGELLRADEQPAPLFTPEYNGEDGAWSVRSFSSPVSYRPPPVGADDNEGARFWPDSPIQTFATRAPQGTSTLLPRFQLNHGSVLPGFGWLIDLLDSVTEAD